MEGNPFLALSSMMGGGASPGLALIFGIVKQIEPLVIEAAELSLSGGALIVNAELLAEKNGTISGHGACAYGSANVTGTCKIAPPLLLNDSVILATNDYQLFYVLFKAVKL